MLLKSRLSSYLLLLILLNIITISVRGQLCTGSLGDPVVKITFGTGPNPGNPLGASITTLNYVNTDCPLDGNYTIRNNTQACFGNTWATLNSDHTGDPNGYMMIINANYQPSDFYVQTIDGLCGNTTYEFAAWVLSLDRNIGSIPVNITFSIEKPDSTPLQSYNTGDILPNSNPQWIQYGFNFKTPSNLTSVVIRMTNNSRGGIGNDLALDDITFSPYGPNIKSSIIGESNPDSTQFCEGSTKNITLNAVASPGYTAPVYQWQLSTDNGNTYQDIPGANSLTYIRKPTSKGKYLYRLAVAESGNGAIASCRVVSNVVILNVSANPVVKLSTNSPVCEGGTLTLTGSVNYNAPLPGTFSFTYPESNPSFISKSQKDDNSTNTSVYSQEIIARLSSSGKYILSAQSSVGCSSKDSAVVLINSRPVAQYSYNNIICEKSTINFTDQSTGKATITSWAWNFGDSNKSVINNPSNVYATAGTYTTSLSVTDANGCISDTIKKDIVVHPLPFTDFVLPKVCLKDPYAQFLDVSTISDNSQSTFQYLWNFGDAAGPSNSSTQKDPQHVYTATGTYSVKLQVTSSNGCIKDTTKAFTVNGSVPQAMFTVDNSNLICSHDTIKITNTSTVNFGNIVKVEIHWDNVNNPNIITTDDSPYVGKKYQYNYTALMNASVKTFSIRYVVYSGISCVNETTQQITINRSPEITFDSLPSVCEESAPFNITAATETTGAAGSGIYFGAGMTTSPFFVPSVAGAGTHIIRYTFTTDAGCASYAEQPITIYPQPVVDAGATKTVIVGASIVLKPAAFGNGLQYLWTPSTYLSNPTDSTPTSTPQASITYKLTVTSSDNCSNSDTVQIKVLNGLYIPTAFTPNNDGLNDVWELPFLDEYPNTVVSIYNRYGQAVYHSVGAKVSWDGSYKGIPQPAGIYVYTVDLKNQKPIYKGTLMLIR